MFPSQARWWISNRYVQLFEVRDCDCWLCLKILVELLTIAGLSFFVISILISIDHIHRYKLFNAMVQSIFLLNVGTGSLSETNALLWQGFHYFQMWGRSDFFQKARKATQRIQENIGSSHYEVTLSKLNTFRIYIWSLKTVRLTLVVLYIGRNWHF